jgi:hypothetical protein
MCYILYKRYKTYAKASAGIKRIAGGPAGYGGVMFADKTKVLLVLPQAELDRARVVAGKATTALKLPVSLQIVLRALIEEGLKRGDDPALLDNIEGQANAVRQLRSVARQGWRAEGEHVNPRSALRRRPGGRERQRRGT